MSGKDPTDTRTRKRPPAIRETVNARRPTPGTRLAVLGLLAVGSFLAAYGATRLRTARGPGAGPPGMRWVPAGEFTMGTASDLGWPDEGPAHRVRVDGFWLDEHEVTNARFRRFVEATGYVTTAERPPDVRAIMAQVPPGTPPPPPETLVPGSLVFRRTDGPVPRDDVSRWWKWTPGANWRHPEGPGSDIGGRDDHPVVQVSWDDAVAYARWAGRRLPTEAEWERAARGGLEGKPYTWGEAEPGAGGRWQANLWQGDFPGRNDEADGFDRTAPVGSFPPNGFGLFDMAGNVWEWCADWYRRDLYGARAGGPVTVNPRGPERPDDPRHLAPPMRVQRGGSFLCNDGYCSRYRPSARHGCSPDTGMSHVGFRCALSPTKQGDGR
jgi:sulfatase modifying factor 1